MCYAKVRGLILEKFKTQEAFAKAMGLNPATINSKLSGKTDWKRLEIERACELLGIPSEQVIAYFFTC